AAARSGVLPLAADWEPAATGESAARAGWFWASKNDPVRTTLTIQNRFFMKNPATFKSQPTHRLDADPRPSVFPYSTLGGPSSAEKAQDRAKAGSTGALDGQCLMSEMSHPGEDHRQAKPVRGFDDLLIAHRTSGLDDGSRPRFGDFLDAVREGEEGIGGSHRALQGQLGLHGAKLACIDAAHLSSADAYRLAIARVENGVRLHVLADLPREKQRPSFFGRRRALRDNFQVGFGQLVQIGILDEHTSRNVFQNPVLLSGRNLDQPQILLRGKSCFRAFIERGSG